MSADSSIVQMHHPFINTILSLSESFA